MDKRSPAESPKHATMRASRHALERYKPLSTTLRGALRVTGPKQRRRFGLSRSDTALTIERELRLKLRAHVKEVKEMAETIRRQRQELDARQAEIDLHKTKIARFAAHCKSLASRYKWCDDERQRLSERLEEREEEVAKLDKENDALHEQKEELQAELDDAECGEPYVLVSVFYQATRDASFYMVPEAQFNSQSFKPLCDTSGRYRHRGDLPESVEDFLGRYSHEAGDEIDDDWRTRRVYSLYVEGTPDAE